MLLRNYLRILPWAQYLSEEDIEHVAAAMRVEDYPDQHVFLYQDKQAKELYLLLEGKVNVCHYGPSGRNHILKTLQPGDFFGLLSISDGKPSVASCGAVGPVKVAALAFSAFLLLHQPGSRIGCGFQYVMAAQLARDIRDRHAMLRNLLVQIYSQPGCDPVPGEKVSCGIKERGET
jgi:CRP-like cAMP-binding protein